MHRYIDEFISFIDSERGLADSTLEAYRRDLSQLYVFVTEQQRSWPPDVEAVQRFMESQSGKQSTSQVRALVAIKVFLRFLFREGYLQRDIGPLLESPKLWQKVPLVMNYLEVERVLDLPNVNTEEGVRDKAILEVLYGTGIRVSELCQLSIYDVSDDLIKVHGKGGKERFVPLGRKALCSIDRYLTTVRSLHEGNECNSLFLTKKGAPVDRIFVWRLVREYARAAGIEKPISPHTFRHTYATHLLDSGADLRVIQDLLGHAHISSTDRYTHVSTAQLREVFRTFHPRWDEQKNK